MSHHEANCQYKQVQASNITHHTSNDLHNMYSNTSHKRSSSTFPTMLFILTTSATANWPQATIRNSLVLIGPYDPSASPNTMQAQPDHSKKPHIYSSHSPIREAQPYGQGSGAQPKAPTDIWSATGRMQQLQTTVPVNCTKATPAPIPLQARPYINGAMASGTKTARHISQKPIFDQLQTQLVIIPGKSI